MAIVEAKKLAADWNLTVDDEFAKVLRDLTPEEQSLLEADIDQFGCNDPILVWVNKGKRIIVDGHHRYRICKTLGIPFGILELEFQSREAVLSFLDNHQDGRRNSTESEVKYRRGKRYEAEKKPRGRPRKDEELSDNECHLKTHERLAQELGVSPQTIKNDAAFASDIDRIAEAVGEEPSVLTGELQLTPKQAAKLAELPKAEQKKAIAGGKAALKEAVSQKKTPEPTPFNLNASLERLGKVVRKAAADFPDRYKSAIAAELHSLAEEFE